MRTNIEHARALRKALTFTFAITFLVAGCAKDDVQADTSTLNGTITIDSAGI